MSVGPPGGNGTTRRTGLPASDCAEARVSTRAAAMPKQRMRLRCRLIGFHGTLDGGGASSRRARELDDLAALGARDVAHLHDLRLHAARSGVVAGGTFDRGGER